MQLPEQEQCFAAFKFGIGHVWQLDSNSCIMNHSVAYHLVMLLDNYIHWTSEMRNLHTPNVMRDICS